ncbi:hypothetical protein D3C87_1955010 [compost metagenome]
MGTAKGKASIRCDRANASEATLRANSVGNWRRPSRTSKGASNWLCRAFRP